MPSRSRAEAIFHEALARENTGERERYVEEVCADDASLQAMVKRLLRAHYEATTRG